MKLFSPSALSRLSLRRKQRRNNAKRRNFQMEPLEPRVVLTVVISEFQASNDTTLADEDGEFTDWIEVHNTGLEAADITGWHLTDDNTNLSQWQFPETALGPDEFLVVFASNKDRAVSGQELHANFRLDAGGEYLGLIEADGITIASEYSPEYPNQFADQSYGLAVGRESEILYAGGSLSTFVPTDGSLGTSWTEVGFDDAAWSNGTSAVGYEQLLPGFTDNDDFSSPLGPEWTVDIPGTGSASVSGGKLAMTAPAGEDADADRGLAPMILKDPPQQNSNFDFETRLRLTSSTGRAGIVVLDDANDTPALKLEVNRISSFISQVQLSSLDTSVQVAVEFNLTDVSLQLSRDVVADTWTASYRQSDADDWTELVTVAEGSGDVPQISDAKLGLITRSPASEVTAEFEYANLDVDVETAIYGPLLGADVESSLFNQGTGVYTRIPFNIDGDPARFDELGMTIRYDDGFIAYLNGTEIARRNVPVVPSWSSAATAPFGAVNGVIPVDGISLNGEVGLLRSGENILAIHGMNVAADDSDFFLDVVSLNAANVLDVTPQPFTTPTPGAVNALPAAAIPTFSVSGGTYVGSQTIEITSTDDLPTLEFRYTTDGTEPTASSTLYTGPITISTSVNLRAKAFDGSGSAVVSPSNTASAAYIAVDATLANRDSNMPIMVIDTQGQAFQQSGSSTHTPGLTALMDVDPVTGRANLVGGIIDYSGNSGQRRRGSSTGGNAKPNLAYETWGGGDDDVDVSLLGVARESDWVLYAPGRFDRAFMHEPFIFEMSNDIGRWAPETHYVEVFNNVDGGVVDAGDYNGVYVLMERIKQGPSREDVADADPAAKYDSAKGLFEQDEAVTGGYMWKIDRADPGEPPFSAGGASINWVYPKHPNNLGNVRKVTPDQQAYVTAYFNEFWSVLNNSDTSIAYDPVDGYEKYIDVDSWIDHHLLNIITMNVDAFRLSGYFHKDAGGKLEMGSIWDFDRAIESTDGRDDDPEEWRGKGGDLGTDFFGESGNGMGGLWWRQLFDDPNFFQRYIDRYYELRQGLFSHDAIDARIDNLLDRIGESGERSWQESTGGVRSEQTPRSSGCHGHVPGTPALCNGTWRGEVENMRSWLHRRIDFMDAQFAPPVTFKLDGDTLDVFPQGVAIASGSEVEMTSPGEGLIYYTTDGTDPRGLDGQPTASAIAYNGFAELITENDGGRFLVPTGAASENGWQNAGFNDASWTSVDNSVGFDEDPSGADLRGEPGFVVRTVNVSAPLMVNITTATGVLDGTTAGTVISDLESVDPYVNHIAAASGGSFNSPSNLKPPGLSSSTTHFATRATAEVTIPVGTWTVAVTSDDGMRLTMPGVEFTNTVNENRSGALGPRPDELISATISTNTTYGTITVSGSPLTTTLQLDHFNFFSNDNLELSIASGEQAFDPANFAILQDGTMGWGVQAADVVLDRIDFSPEIDTDVSSLMLDNNSSAYIRYPFNLTRGSDVLDLQAEFQYDDGFVAYLNGTEVLRVAAPNNTTFNSTASEERDNLAAQDKVQFSLNDHLDALLDGDNVLAVQALNVLPDDTDFLFSATLAGKVKGTPIVLTENTRIVARNLDEADRGPQSNLVTTDWSAIITHDFIVESPDLAITEINYNPVDPTMDELAADDTLENGAFEFVEIQNLSNVSADLIGVQLTNGVQFDFGNSAITSLAPGGRALVVRDADAFSIRYGGGLPVAGEFSGSLSNNGELLELRSSNGDPLFVVSYNDRDPWPAVADGSGATLELIDPAGTETERHGKYYSWRASTDWNGSPGTAGAAPIGVVINEVLSRSDDPNGPSDAVELHNTTGSSIDIGGWYLSDADGFDDMGNNRLLKYEIPAGTSIPAGGYVVYDESNFNAPGAMNGFAFDSAEGDDVFLVVPGGDGVESIVDAVEFGAANDLESFGRVPNGFGRLAPMTTNTFGSENAPPRFGPLLLTELNYNPGPPSQAALDEDPDITSTDLEFVEVHNPTGSAVDMTNWQVRGGVDYDFDEGTMLGAGESVVLVPFNPDRPDNALRVAAFRAHYGLGNSVTLLGGYGGNLNNSSERVQLQRPDTPPIDQPGLIPGLYEDEVLYDDLSPWPAADGTGVTINRTGTDAYGNDANSWLAGAPSPGVVDFTDRPGDFTGDGLVDVADINALCGFIGGPFMEEADLNRDGTVDNGDVETLVTGIIGSPMGDANLDGRVSATDLNEIGLHWQQQGGADWSTGDFTCDGNVTAADLNVVGINWQAGVAAAQVARPPRAPLAGMDSARSAVMLQYADRAVVELADRSSSSLVVETAEPVEESLPVRQRHNLVARRSLRAQPSQEAQLDSHERLADELFADFDRL